MPAIILLLFLVSANVFCAEVTPLPRAHAHNDYEHARPLLDALAQGFCSVEADIHLVDGALLVAHDPEHIKPDRTLESLYLAPLRDRALKNGGRIYPGGPTLLLLIDIKTEAESTYSELKKLLERHEKILTRFTGDRISTNAVTVVLSGNRPRATLRTETNRLAAFDGRLADLGQNLPVSFMPLVSDNWRSHFKWTGQGDFPESERKKLENLVARAHQEERKLRFWATPDTRSAWAVLHAAGVDLLNTDDLPELAKFLQSH